MTTWILGFLNGLIMVIVIFIIACKKRKCVYDERQLIARGKAFRSGFISFTALFIIGLYLYAKKSSDITLLAVEIGGVIILLISFLVFTSHCIWANAYFPLTTCKKKAVYISFLTLSLINTLIFLIRRNDVSLLNFICGIFIFLVWINILLKDIYTKKIANKAEETTSTFK